jgi:hypothetical protein
MDTLKSYTEELKEDTKVDEINLKEKALFLPGIKAKWVARMINHKNELNHLEKKKAKAITDLIERYKAESPIKLHAAVAKDKAETDSSVLEINRKIQEEKLLIDFLERVEKIFSSMSFDLSNIVKIVQLETT